LVPFSQSIYAKATSASVTLIYPERSQSIVRIDRGETSENDVPHMPDSHTDNTLLDLEIGNGEYVDAYSMARLKP
jgi:hypothetical protein